MAYKPLALTPKKYVITNLSDASIIHHIKALGINGIEYPNIIFIICLDGFSAIYFQTLETKIANTMHIISANIKLYKYPKIPYLSLTKKIIFSPANPNVYNTPLLANAFTCPVALKN